MQSTRWRKLGDGPEIAWLGRLLLPVLAMVFVASCATRAVTVGPSVPDQDSSVVHLTSTPTRVVWPNTWTPRPTPTLTATATRVVEASTPTSEPPDAATVTRQVEAATPLPTTETISTPASARGSQPSVREDTITVNTYQWQNALVDTAPDDVIYPYPRLNRDLLGPPAPQTYKTVVLENEYVRLVLLPELGGRIYRWLDKPSKQEMFYVNPVIKPTQWGARGWWFATGGMEWAFPVEEHGLVEWRPWDYRIARDGGQVSVTLSDQDDRTGLVAQVTVALQAGRSYLTVAPSIRNPTAAEQSFQFWLNGMFALSPSNRPSADLRFFLPGDSVTVHSTGDQGVPKAGEEMGWPVHSGRDMSRYGNWAGWLGIFAWSADYMGAYDPLSGMGVVRVSPPNVSQGAKIFGAGNLDPGLWTDDDSGYVELWGGLTRTFWDYASLSAGESIGWQEHWYSVNDLGGLSYANDQAALWLSAGTESVQVGALATMPMEGRLLLWRNGQMVSDWNVVISPSSPFRVDYTVNGDSTWGLQLLDSSDEIVCQCGDF